MKISFATVVTVTLVAATSNALAITLDSSISFEPNSAFNAAFFNASGSDKLVIVATGEHSNPGNTTGNINTLTYDGVSLTRVVDRNPVSSTDQTVTEIWYLDNPGAVHVAGDLAATVNGNGNNYVFTLLGLSGTAPGVGATAISAADSKSVDLLAVGSDSFVVAAHAMGGNGNTANVGSVNALLPATEIAALEAGSNWAGHVVSVTNNVGPGLATYTFTGGSTGGVVTIAAEFLAAAPAVPEPASASLALLGLAGLMMRRRRLA